MNLSIKYTFLEVTDHEAALAFYRDAPGLEVRQDVAFETDRWLTVGPASQPELGVVLATAGVGRPPEDARAIRELLAKGSLSGLVLEAEDVDATFERIRASGAGGTAGADGPGRTAPGTARSATRRATRYGSTSGRRADRRRLVLGPGGRRGSCCSGAGPAAGRHAVAG